MLFRRDMSPEDSLYTSRSAVKNLLISSVFLNQNPEKTALFEGLIQLFFRIVRHSGPFVQNCKGKTGFVARFWWKRH